jgi:hypothetical protein
MLFRRLHAAQLGPQQVAKAPLERLVRERARAFPDRVDEWTYYLIYLREYADAGGRLPETFEPLIEEVFAEILGAT